MFNFFNISLKTHNLCMYIQRLLHNSTTTTYCFQTRHCFSVSIAAGTYV